MKVRIIKSGFWHTGMIGREFEAYIDIHGFATITTLGSYRGNGLYKTDYEVVEEATPDKQYMLVRLTKKGNWRPCAINVKGESVMGGLDNYDNVERERDVLARLFPGYTYALVEIKGKHK